MQRISLQKNKEFQTIEILPLSQPPKNLIMQLWLALWSACGAMVLYQLFTASDSNTKIICIIYMGFWSYFEFLILRIYRWRKTGKEEVEIHNNKLVITRLTKGRGLPVTFDFNGISNLRIDTTQKQNMFGRMLFDEYWTAGNECILFEYNKKQHGFGFQLNEDDANQVTRYLDAMKRKIKQ